MVKGVIPCRDREQWLVMRQSYFDRPMYNASEMAAYCGDHPYKSAHEAWLEKTRQKQREDLSENVNILRGIEREPFIRQKFIEENESWAKFTYKQFDIYFISIEEYVLGATLDLEFEVKTEENPYGFKKGELGIVEIKSVLETPQTFNTWKDAPPVYYQEQQYAQLMASGKAINILVAEFDKELENGLHEYRTRAYPPIIVDPQNLFRDPNVAELHMRLAVFSKCVDTKTPPDKHIQGTDAEIVFKADVVDLGSFYSNYEEVKSAVEVAVAPYKSMVVTEDSEKDGKAVRAQLNKVKKSIDDKRKEVCAIWDAPKNEFIAKCNEIVKVVDSAIGSVDRQLKAVEEGRVIKKQAAIEEIKSKVLSALFLNQSSLLDYFDQCGGVVYDARWENRGTSESAIKKDIQTQIESFKIDFSSMENFKSDGELFNAMLMAYKRSRSLSEALKAKSELENAREISRRAQAEKTAEPTPEPVRSEPIPEQIDIKLQSSFPSTEQKYTLSFELYHVTKDQLSELNNYLKGRGISFKRTNVIKEADNG